MKTAILALDQGHHMRHGVQTQLNRLEDAPDPYSCRD